MLYVIYPNTDIWTFVLGDICRDDVVLHTLNECCNIWQQIVRKIFRDRYVPARLLFNSRICKDLKKLHKGDSLLLCGYSDLCLVKGLNKCVCKDVKKYYWIWDPIKDDEKVYYRTVFETMRKENFEPSTFDPLNANEFSLNLYKQFFKKIEPQEENILYDFYFIGFAKKRESLLENLSLVLKNYRLNFKLVHNVTDYITYKENINNVLHTRCIVDIVQDGQMGITLRPLEALFLKKKIITNNKSIINESFYSPKNIFVIGLDDFSKIKEFIESPFFDIEDNIVKQYTVDAWLNHFVESK